MHKEKMKAMKPHEHFTVLHQPISHNERNSPEEFQKALDTMGIENIIENSSIDNRALTSPSTRVLVHSADEESHFQAYAYLSPIGYLQIWMVKSINRNPEPTVLATARFSWTLTDQTPEHVALHDKYAKRMYEILHP